MLCPAFLCDIAFNVSIGRIIDFWISKEIFSFISFMNLSVLCDIFDHLFQIIKSYIKVLFMIKLMNALKYPVIPR